MPTFIARLLIRAARTGWRFGPIGGIDQWLRRVQQALAMAHGYGLECLDDEVGVASSRLPARSAVIFDVGAHKGEWSRGVLARRRGAGDHFVLFEPSLVNITTLRGMAVPEFTIVPYAVSDRVGCVPLFSDVIGSGIGSLHQRDLEPYGMLHKKQEEVRTTTLDEFAESSRIERIDYLKLDVEGHELAALRGADRLLRDRRIRALSFEFGGTQVDSRLFFRDYWKLLTSHKYRIYRLLPGGALLPMDAYDVALEVFRLTTYVAFAMPA